MTRRLAAVPDRPRRFAIGVRVSKVGKRSGERFLSPSIQIEGARRVIAAAGGVLDETVGEDGVFYDLDVSGAVAPSTRPGLGAALDLVRAGALQGIAIYDLSRWSRETSSGLRELEQIAALGAQVLSASEAIDLETPTGVFSTTVQLAAHQLRRAEASRGWKATHANRFDRGLPHGKVPLGYVMTDGRAEVSPDLGPAVTTAFASYAAGTVSQKMLAADLGRLRGKPMRQGVVSQMLRNRFYVGEVTYNGETKRGVHTALVTPEVFAAVQERLTTDREAGPHARVPKSAAIGLVFCAHCEQPAYRRGKGQTSGGRRLPALICAGKHQGTCDGFGAPRCDDVDRALLTLALQVADDLADGTPQAVARRSKAAKGKAAVKQLTAERDDLLNQIGRLGVSHARGVMNEQAYDEALKILQPELDAAEARLRAAQASQSQVERPAEQLRSAAARLALLWDEMEPLEQRAALKTLVPRVMMRRAAYRGEPIMDRLSVPEES